MTRKILRWVIMTQAEYERLMKCERAVKILCNATKTLIDIIEDLMRITFK